MQWPQPSEVVGWPEYTRMDIHRFESIGRNYWDVTTKGDFSGIWCDVSRMNLFFSSSTYISTCSWLGSQVAHSNSSCQDGSPAPAQAAVALGCTSDLTNYAKKSNLWWPWWIQNSNPVLYDSSDADSQSMLLVWSHRDRQPAGSRTAVPSGWGSSKGRVSIVRGVRDEFVQLRAENQRKTPGNPVIGIMHQLMFSGMKTTETMCSESCAFALNVNGFGDLPFLSTPQDRKVRYPFGNGKSPINRGLVCWENHRTN